MNTRLQVEHPVTELVTGIDLVEQMIRVAAGEKLALKQGDVQAHRLGDREPGLCRGPVPQFPALDRPARRATGRRPKSSADGVTVRNDTGVFEGGEISIYYDPMIAKLVTHAPTRDAAIEAQADALDAFAIDGIRHNIPFLAALMQHKRWQAGKLSTGIHRRGISRRLPSRRAGRRELHACWPRSPRRSTMCWASASAASPASAGRAVDARARSAWCGSATARSVLDDRARRDGARGAFRRRQQEAPVLASALEARASRVWSGTIDGAPVAVQVRADPQRLRSRASRRRGARLCLHRARGGCGAADAGEERGRQRQGAACPMPGLVVSIAVARRPGGQGGRDARRGRGHEDGECAARRARRHGEDDQAKPGDSLAVDAVIMEFA